MKTRIGFSGALARTAGSVFLAVLALHASNGSAQYSLAPGDNSTVQVNPVGGNLVQNWDINGIDISDSTLGGFQGLYYQVGGGVATPIQSGIGPLSVPSLTVVGDTATLNTTYGSASTPFSLQAAYTLTGGPVGSPNSDLTEVINVKNNQASALNFRFFQYANFTVPNASVSLQTSFYRGNNLFTLAQVSGGPVSLSEYVDGTLNPGANEGTVTPSLVALTTTPGYGLPGPAVNTSGPGGAWLLEWDVTIPVDGTFILSKDMYATVLTPTPEPAAFSLLSLGLIGFGAFKFYRRSSAK